MTGNTLPKVATEALPDGLDIEVARSGANNCPESAITLSE